MHSKKLYTRQYYYKRRKISVFFYKKINVLPKTEIQ